MSGSPCLSSWTFAGIRVTFGGPRSRCDSRMKRVEGERGGGDWEKALETPEYNTLGEKGVKFDL